MSASSCGRAAASRCTLRGDEGVGARHALPVTMNLDTLRGACKPCVRGVFCARKNSLRLTPRLPRREIIAWSLLAAPRARHAAAAQPPTPLLRETLSYERFSRAGRWAGGGRPHILCARLGAGDQRELQGHR